MRGAVWTVLVCSLLACASAPQHATYPSWEPTSPVVPKLESRAVARRYLEASRAIWNQYKLERYSYVRARQLAADRVHFTLLVVDHGKVVERALLATRPGDSGLGDRMAGKHGHEPKLLWHERGAGVGTHEGGAPPLTIDQLYDLCRDQVLGAHPELVPRL